MYTDCISIEHGGREGDKGLCTLVLSSPHAPKIVAKSGGMMERDRCRDKMRIQGRGMVASILNSKTIENLWCGVKVE